MLGGRRRGASSERDWSMFGNIFTKTRNRLALVPERAHKMAYIRTNSSLGGKKGADEEIRLSVMDVLDEEEADDEEEA